MIVSSYAWLLACGTGMTKENRNKVANLVKNDNQQLRSIHETKWYEFMIYT